ncbi:MAG: hypothetical protein JOY84_01210 [Curvibacter sp.]|nr:hypothetical protein [Curvibacter sp.]
MVEPARLPATRTHRRTRGPVDLSRPEHRRLAFALLAMNRATIPGERLLSMLQLDPAQAEPWLIDLVRMGVLRWLPRFRTHCYQLQDPAALLAAYVDHELTRPHEWQVRHYHWPEDDGRLLLTRVAHFLAAAQADHASTGVPIYDYVAPARRLPLPVCFHVEAPPHWDAFVPGHELAAHEAACANVILLCGACPFGVGLATRQLDGIRFVSSFQTYLDALTGRLPMALDPEEFRWAHLAY